MKAGPLCVRIFDRNGTGKAVVSVVSGIGYRDLLSVFQAAEFAGQFQDGTVTVRPALCTHVPLQAPKIVVLGHSSGE